MRGFKMFKKNERDYMVEEIKKEVSESLKKMELSDADRFLIEEFRKALVDELIKINLSGIGFSKDEKEFIVKVEFQADIETMKRVLNL